MRRLVLTAALALCCSCSTGKSPVAATVRSAERDPVICRIVGRCQTIVVRASVNGPTYSAESRNGSILVPAMTLDQIAMREPGLFRSIKTMQAGVYWAGR
jgi:hypothetical protein